MADVGSQVKRQYTQVRRAQSAELTRRALLGAGRELFLSRGYIATTISAIAHRAHVSPKTINLTFGTKAGLFQAIVHVAVAGDDAPVAIADRHGWRTMLTQPPAAMLERFARGTTQVHQRTARLFAVAEIAASVDLEIAAMRRGGLAARARDYAQIAQSLHTNAALRPGLSVADATDHLLAISSDATYRTLIEDRGWTSTCYTGWLTDTLHRTLVDDSHRRVCPDRRLG